MPRCAVTGGAAVGDALVPGLIIRVGGAPLRRLDARHRPRRDRSSTATERLVEQAVGRLLAGRTAIVIAHRLTSVDHPVEAFKSLVVYPERAHTGSTDFHLPPPRAGQAHALSGSVGAAPSGRARRYAYGRSSCAW